jgi:uncharacterized protein YgbK (DUF1537 family)
MKGFVNVAKKDGVSMSESIAQKLIDAAKDWVIKSHAYGKSRIKSKSALECSVALLESKITFNQLAQEVEDTIEELEGELLARGEFHE